MKLEAETQYVVPMEVGHLRMTRLSRRLALLMAGHLDERGCERVVLAAYPGLALRARVASRSAPGRWLRQTLQRRYCGLVEDLALEALRIAGVPVEVEGLQKIRAARERLADIEASRVPILSRGELTRAAYPTRHPGLRFTSSAVRRPVFVAPRAVCVRHRGRAARPGHVRRRRCSTRAPDDPGESEPGEIARRAADDCVTPSVLLGVVA